MPRRAELDAAYRATTYQAWLDGERVAIRIGQAEPGLDRWLARCGACRWAWISAANPGSQRLDDVDNRRRHEGLLAQVVAAGWPFAVSESIADAADWPPEAGLLIADIDAGAAVGLAQRWGQNALLLGEAGDVARLVWTGAVSS